MRTRTAALDIDRLWRIAGESLGAAPPLPDGDVHGEGLRLLAAAMERRAVGDAAALRVVRRDLFAWILSYLHFARDLDQHPEIAAVPVERPLFIIAFGRTGSTLLHNLLALAPGARAPLLWEILTPAPALAEHEAAGPRIEIARQRLKQLAEAAPLVSKIHPMAAEAPDECHWMMRHGPLWAVFYDLPEYWDWLKSLSAADLRRLYAHYRLQIQHLMLFRSGTWISKSFSHLHFLPVLYDVFPDARLVRLHRHPAAAIASLCSLARSYRSIFSTRIDPGAIGAGILDLFADGMGRAMALDRARPEAPVVDLAYDALVADPVGATCGVLEKLGYPLSGDSERAMRAYVERAAARPSFRHDYTLEEFGLSRPELVERCSAYLDWAASRCGRALSG